MIDIGLVRIEADHYRPVGPGERATHRVRYGRVVPALPEPPSPCHYLGEQTGELAACPSCGGNPDAPKVSLKLHGCAVHGSCTQAKAIAGIACCAGCTDRGVAILLTGGIGDFLTLETMMREQLRGELAAVYYACPAAAEISTLCRALSLPRVKHFILPTGANTYYDLATVRGAVGTLLPPHVEDWSIGMRFPRYHYRPSSFLTQTLATPPAIDRPYVVIAHRSDWGQWSRRELDAGDWARLLATLEAHDLAGVVLSRARAPLPVDSPRLIDLQGQTTILESIEVLKGAAGYLGIDSALSVLAAKLFPAHRIAVKSVSPHLRQWRQVYYAPCTDFGFVREQLEPSWI